MQLEPKEIHVWSTDLAIGRAQEEANASLLSPAEMARANRFLFPIHKRRFIASHAALREIIGLYLNLPPDKIVYQYGDHGKPSLSDANFLPLQFNVTHSDELAVFAFTLNHPIGIDIEKIQETYNEAVAKRYFTREENAALMHLPAQARVQGFYRLWARKEAIIKAIGKGLAIPLSSFSVSGSSTPVNISLEHETWTLIDLSIHADYQSALATTQQVEKISYWNFLDRKYTLEKQTKF